MAKTLTPLPTDHRMMETSPQGGAYDDREIIQIALVVLDSVC